MCASIEHNEYIQVEIDVSLLVERCEYFKSYFSFYHLADLKKDLDIELPSQMLLSRSSAIYMLMILSEENDTCRTLLDDIKDIKSIVFFAIYFQSGFLFKYIKERVIKNVDEIANILQVSIFCQGEMHQFSKEIIWFTADFMRYRCVHDVLELMTDSKQADDDSHNVEYQNTGELDNALTERKIAEYQNTLKLCQVMKDRDVSYGRMLDIMPYYCAVCGKKHKINRIQRTKRNLIYMKCCGSPARINCHAFLKFISFYWKGEIAIGCKECSILYVNGRPDCTSLYMKWQRRKFRELRRKIFLDRISFFCKYK